MAKLSDYGRIEKKTGEINIVFEPQIPFPIIKNLVNECATGNCSCGCDPQMLATVDEFVVEDGPDGPIVRLKGEQVKVQEVEKNFAHCDVKLP